MNKEEQEQIQNVENKVQQPKVDKENKPKKQNKNNKQKKAPKTPAVVKKLKILCLHGYAQNLTIFHKRTAVLKKALKSIADLCMLKIIFNIKF